MTAHVSRNLRFIVYCDILCECWLCIHVHPFTQYVPSIMNSTMQNRMNRYACIHIYERNIDAALFDVTDSSSLFIDKGIDQNIVLVTISILSLFYTRLSPYIVVCCASFLFNENNCRRNLTNRLTFLYCEIFFRTSGGRARNDVLLASNIIPDPVLPYFCLYR